MQTQHLLLSIVMGIGAWVLPLGTAHADTVLYASSGFIQGQESFVQPLDITTRGTITVTLSDIPWLDTIANLNCFLSTATGVVGSPMGAGTESIGVGPGMIYAHWYGTAKGAYGVGVYGIKISFQSGGSPVPLPASLILLLSGLVVLLAWRRRPIGSVCRGSFTQ